MMSCPCYWHLGCYVGISRHHAMIVLNQNKDNNTIREEQYQSIIQSQNAILDTINDELNDNIPYQIRLIVKRDEFRHLNQLIKV